ncbi:hypothetical protein PPL_02913 [Heterostelium album PN500]|uniref:Uncharacterized protein n=1 Tax=Heterostelium pallidum (strain ATCC 26659 / Pp 5 / PN500) TaxID=670386 RepID=D3B3E6_HETP5|nr:hypothetical protein PPL_02913 [Heterostelium album PN500]EFA83844.1 hypothetical protein PPL_02913 [Heterostelium album PN500]|eukprot:XP_020435961.1 hypothetical protein PPL_02913 [Heterostelium album PN500]
MTTNNKKRNHDDESNVVEDIDNKKVKGEAMDFGEIDRLYKVIKTENNEALINEAFEKLKDETTTKSKWSSIPIKLKETLINEACMTLLSKNQYVHNLFIPYIAKLIIENYDTIDSIKQTIEQMFEKFEFLPTIEAKRSCLKLIDLIFRDNEEYGEAFHDIASSLSIITKHVQTLPPQYHMEFLILLVNIVSKCPLHNSDNLVDLAEVLRDFSISDEFEPESFTKTIIETLESTTLPIETIQFFSNLLAIFFAHFSYDANPREEYISLMFKWISQVPYDDILEAWIKDPNADTVATPKESSANESIVVLSNAQASWVFDCFKPKWDAAMKSKDWKQLYYCGNILGQIHENCIGIITDTLYMEMLDVIISPPNQMIQNIYLNLTSMVFQERGDDMEDELIGTFLEKLLALENPSAFIQPSILKAIGEIIDEKETEIIDDEMSQKIFNYIKPFLKIDQPSSIIENSISVFTSLVDIAGIDDFIEFKDQYLMLLIDVLQKNVNGFNDLKGRVMEAMSVLGTILPKQDKQYDEYVVQAIQLIRKLEPSCYTKQTDFYMRAHVRFAQRLGNRFEPYLDSTYQYLLKVMSSHSDPSHRAKLEAGDVLLIDNIKLAMEMTMVLTESTVDFFHRYVGSIATEVLKLIDFDLDDTIKSDATNTLPKLFAFYKLNSILSTKEKKKDLVKNDDGPTKLFKIIANRLVKSMEIEEFEDALESKQLALQICGQINKMDLGSILEFIENN